jgi:hypothetical protein
MVMPACKVANKRRGANVTLAKPYCPFPKD